MDLDLDLRRVAVGVVLIFALTGMVGYAYVAGVGPLEENPAAGLEEPPETEGTYSFGDVPENGTAVSGGVGGGVDKEGSDRAEDGAKDRTVTDGAGTGGDESSDDRVSGVVDKGEDRNGNGTAGGKQTEEKEDTETEPNDLSDEQARDSNDTSDSDNEGGVDREDDREDDGDDERNGQEGDTKDRDTDRNGDRGGGADSRGISTLEAGSGPETETTGPPFAVEIENMEKCGETCRKATVALQNRMDVAAEDIVVFVRLYAGESTNPDNVVWADNRKMGTLEAGEVYRTTDRIDLTTQQANNVREENGRVTAEATIRSQQATARFVGQDDVN